ncbi:5-(carboxyamino)imidazole ribonucleotide synthase [Candidatus Methylacidiphilum infernorum]|uniref:N5-carboxyaminoimidazole ribonucleotide synthase n=1 Tax=Candidatus Methylacidiphilum infernorum TaxID=511746 RepID=A0ABX7PWU6_9BACT|nr:5-(carboxyamino)imidazole ribonucleotide synthase [Candidatus Methylacidiphilum infernorum]QSR87469.1 5-(carboxyamino)imidazole ribonucleotide synthase [Candidatus Methylacidiphilum infernorum]
MKEILPGSTIGILGGGQLGRMTAMEARRLGYDVEVYDPDPLCPAAGLSSGHWSYSYEDLDRLKAFARSVDILTYEFENIPSGSVKVLEENFLVCPSASVLAISQDRVKEKQFLAQNGFPVAPFRVVRTLAELTASALELGLPVVLKTVQLGYDGKGQVPLDTIEDCRWGWKELGEPQLAIVEKKINLLSEFSVILALGYERNFSFLPIPRNYHRKGILDYSIVPSGLGKEVEEAAKEIALEIALTLGVVGLLTVEFFLAENQQILVNELAPRPHNSGHFSLDSCITSQFEQLIRAICKLPLGQSTLKGPVLMRNLLGDLWRDGRPPNWPGLLKIPGLKLHLYDKKYPRPGRKMGHYSLLGEDLKAILASDKQALKILQEDLEPSRTERNG